MNKKILLVATLLACAYPFVSHADAVDEVQQVQTLQAENSRTIHVETAGTLSTLITADEIKQLSELKVTGEINDNDRSFLHNVLAGQNFPISLDFSEATALFNSWSCYQWWGVTGIKLPKGITQIGDFAFLETNIPSVTIPEGVISIGYRAFSGCPTLDLLEFTSNTPPQIGEDCIPDITTIVVPKDAYDLYKNLPYLQRNANLGHILCKNPLLTQSVDVKALNSSSALLNAMGDEGMKNVFDLTIKGSINGYDFMMLRNKMPNLHHLDMTDVEIVANPYEYEVDCHSENHRLGKNFFKNSFLTRVKLPKSITYIDESAFENCSGLREVLIFPGVTDIDERVFYNCTSLQEIDVPENVFTIGKSAFQYCHKLQRITLGEGLVEIGADAFEGCVKVESLILPSTLRRIGRYAFRNMHSLKSIHIPPSVQEIGLAAFSDDNVLNDVYVYVANPKDIYFELYDPNFPNKLVDVFSSWKSATLHAPSFGYNQYYLDPIWGQFAHLEKFDEPYETFYTKNTLTLDSNTGTIDGTPDALFYEHGSLEVNDNEVQPLDEVTLVHDGKDGASLIPEQTGNITVETLGIDINVRANSWHFFSFPFDIDLASIKYDGDYIWRQYDGAKRSRREGGWQNLAAGTTVLKAGRGYIFQGTTAGVLHLEVSHPEITAENVNTELKTYATADTDPADASWNFIGNPYTSYYAVDEATYAAPITIWTGNGYEAYRPGDDDYEFAPYEAFFVQTPTGTSAVNFNADNREGYEEMQAAQSQRRMARAQKKVNPNRLLVNLELGVQGEEEYLDKTRVVFNDECSLDYESDCDAAKFFSDERRAELYTIGTDGTQYAINERPEDGGYVDLGFVANQKGKYTISAQRMDVPMLLIDDVMETTFDLRNGAYEFSSAKGTFNKRFSLKRYEGITTSIKDLADQIGMTFSISDGSISVDGLDASTRVSLYNTAGQQIATQQGNGTMAAIPGTYVISVGKLTAKVIVK